MKSPQASATAAIATTRPKTAKRVILSALLLGTLAAGGFTAKALMNANSTAARWERLTQERTVDVLFRSLPAVQDFLDRELRVGDGETAKLNTEILFGSTAKNTYDSTISLIDEAGVEGLGTATLYYHNWDAKSSSVQIALDLEPAFIARMRPSPIQKLIKRALVEGSASDSIRDVHVEVTRENDRVWLFLRLALPGNWLVDVPDMDRGFGVTMATDLAGKLKRLARAKLLKDRYAMIPMQLPSQNPPGANWSDPVGSIRAHLRVVPNGPLLPVQLYTTATTGFDRDVTYYFELSTSEHGERSKIDRKAFMDLLDPALLQAAEKSAGSLTKDNVSTSFLFEGVNVSLQLDDTRCMIQASVPADFKFPEPK